MDLVYLHGWHQAVTSVEDQEFRERALGGPDTTTRWRRTRRLETRESTRSGIEAMESVDHVDSRPTRRCDAGRRSR